MEKVAFEKEVLQQLSLNSQLAMDTDYLTESQRSFVYLIQTLMGKHFTFIHKQDPYDSMGYSLDVLLENAEWLCAGNIPVILRAKIMDIKWIKRQDWNSRKEACQLFKSIIEKENDEDILYYSIYRYILLSRTDKKAQRENATSTIYIALDKLQSLAPDRLVKVLTLCYEYKVLPDNEIAMRCEANISDDRCFKTVEGNMELAEKAYGRASGDYSNKILEIQMARIEYYKKLAHENGEDDAVNYGRKRQYLQYAINELKRTKAYPNYIKEVENLKLEYDSTSEKFVASMQYFSHPIDYSQTADMLRKKIDSLSLESAICFLLAPEWLRTMSRTTIRERVISKEGSNFFEQLFTSAKLDRKGHTLYRMPALNEQDENSVSAHMEQHAAKHYGHVAISIIYTIIQLIRQKEGPADSVLTKIVETSDWIPENRKKTWVTGILAGYHGDFCVATNVLAPQLEAWVRYITEECDGVTYSMNVDGIEQANTLDYLLSCTTIQERLDEDIIFTLKVLLVSPYGCNLRNRVAHGLLDDDQYSAETIFLWWFALYLCFLHAYPFYQPISNQSKSNDEDAEQEGNKE